MRRLLVLGCAAVTAVWAVASAAQEGMPPALVKVDAVREQPMSQTVPVIGRLVPRQQGVVASRAEGPVDEIRAEVGDRVEKGAVIAVLERSRIQARVDLAVADLRLAQQQLDRLAGLRKSKSAAHSKAQYDDAVQQVARAEASLRLAKVELRDTETRAPYSGVVSVRHTEVGSFVKEGDPVVTLVNDTNMEVEADVPYNRVGGLAAGIVVELQLDDGSKHQATVRAVVPSENARSRTRAVRFVPRFNGTTTGLAADQSVTVDVPIGKASDVLSVHKDAIINRNGKDLVYVVDGDKVQIRPVTLGPAVGGRFQVLGGLEPGNLVVIRGNERLRPGQPVQYEQGS